MDACMYLASFIGCKLACAWVLRAIQVVGQYFYDP